MQVFGEDSYIPEQDKIKKQFYPLDFVQYFHSKNPQILLKIEENHKKLFDKANSFFSV